MVQSDRTRIKKTQDNRILDRSEERYRLLLETIPHGIQECDTSGIITFANEAHARMYGCSVKDLIGKAVWELVDSDDEKRKLRDYLSYLVEEQPDPTPFVSVDRTNDGRTIEVQVDWNYNRDKNGDLVGFVSVLTDITERLKAEASQRESESWLNSILASLYECAVAVYDLEGRITALWGTPEMDERYGMRAADAVGHMPSDLLPPEQSEFFLGQLKQVVETGKKVLADVPMTFPNGNFWQTVSLSRIYDENRQVTGVVGFYHDVTERKQVETALRESEAQFRRAIEDAPIPIMIHAEDGEILQISKTWTELTGYSHEQIPTLNDWVKRSYGLDWETVKERIQIIFDLEDRMDEGEYEISTSTGEKRIWSFSTSPLGTLADGRRLVTSMATDITERKKAEQALKTAHDGLEQRVEERTVELAEINRKLTEEIEVRTRVQNRVEEFGRILDESLSEIYVFDAESHRFVQVNRGARENLGYTMEELRELTPLDLKVEYSEETFSELISPLRTGERKKIQFETFHRRKDGSSYPVEVHLQLSTFENSPCFIAVILDIEKRKHSEAELRMSAEIIDNMAEGVCLVRASDNCLVFTNPRFDGIFGYEKGELIGKHVTVLITAGERSPEVTAESIIQEVRENGSWSGDIHNIRKDGTDFWTQATVSKFQHPVFGEVWVSVQEDISEQKQVADALRRSESKFRRVFETNVLGIIFSNVNGEILDANDRMLDMIGYSREDLRSDRLNWRKLTPPEFLPLDERALEELAQTSTSTPFEKEYIRKDGSRIPILIGSAMLDDSPISGVCFVIDNTDRKRAEEKLKASTKRLQDILDGLYGFVGLYTTDGILIDANRAPLEAAGLKKEDVIGKYFWDTYWWSYSVEVQNQLKDALERAAKGETVRYDTPVRIADGRLIDIDVTFGPLYDSEGNITQLLGFAVDITDRKLAIRDYREKQSQLDNLLSNVDAIIMEGDPFDIYYVGGQVEKILGYPKEIWFEHPKGPVGFWSELLHPDDKGKFDICMKAIERGEDHTFEYRLIAKDGRQIWFYDSVMVETQDGKPVKTRAVMIDITERKRAEESIQAKNYVLEGITRVQREFLVDADPHQSFDRMLDFLLQMTQSEYGFIGEVHHRPDGQPYLKTHAITNIAWNDETRAFYEKHASDGMEFSNLNTLFGEVLTTASSVIANDPSHDPRSGGIPHEHPPLHNFLGLPFFHKDKLIGMVGLANRPGGFDESIVKTLAPLLTTCSSIVHAFDLENQRKRAEEEARSHLDALAHVNRLSTMGEMATGMAHELNQPLAAISIYSFVGQQALEGLTTDDSQKLRNLFENLSEQVSRAGNIIHRLRALVQKSPSMKEEIDITKLVETVLALFESDLQKSGFHVRKNFLHSSESVFIDEIQIQQVLVNLIRNAIDAMNDAPGDHNVLEIGTCEHPEGTIEISVSDSGPGISPQDKQKIFDAFFSTKSEGMGMGLAISRSIVESHGGNLRMTENEERGLTFRLTIPREKEIDRRRVT